MICVKNCNCVSQVETFQNFLKHVQTCWKLQDTAHNYRNTQARFEIDITDKNTTTVKHTCIGKVPYILIGKYATKHHLLVDFDAYIPAI